ncbi:MAG TPA: hypothetical protein VEG30_07395 [Terriglobales bacterium]|nr:hypothetical protein [Terriglobales bacterium]
MDYDILLHLLAAGLVLSGWILLIAFWLQFRSDTRAHAIYEREKSEAENGRMPTARNWTAASVKKRRDPQARDPRLAQKLPV